MITALIMAGGKGSRMILEGEKPLIKIAGKPMIQHVIEAARNSSKLDRIIVATSPNTPKTSKFAQKIGVDVFETPGDGYIEDLAFFISKRYPEDENEVIVTITSDLPLIDGETIDEVIIDYELCGKPAMCVAVPLEIFRENGLKPSIIMGDMVPSGLNILRSTNKQQDEEVLIMGKVELALNINSCSDIIILEELLRQTHK
ncbi:NTP transferase domain-containing protein [Methanobacterium aggregans]|uniref:NTP transferase domain-containing protein n=1 Tax=Methanobacterium aggregans TaxID=1615586 RepID=UPI001AEB6FFE|nr:NTP transferase domain-containing protein [Methanobacterium aggregans]MBP2046273.1 adenosylcobinamide-phosphate guanylyltransferase [Methanobacterium aggregans]